MRNRLVGNVAAGNGLFVAPPELSVSAAARRMREANVGALMVVQAERLIGIFTERDALFRVVAAGLDADTITLAQVMTRDPLTVAPERTFGFALHLMHENGFRHVPVVVDGRPVGMVSARDALAEETADFEGELRLKASITEILA